MVERVTIYHKVDGAKEMPVIDARPTLARHRDEWSAKPWPENKPAPVIEIDESMRDELVQLTNAELHRIAADENIEVETNDNKATMVDKILKGRAAKG